MFDVVEGLRILNEGQWYLHRSIEIEIERGDIKVTVQESETTGKGLYTSQFIISKEQTKAGADEMLFMMHINSFKEEAKNRAAKYKSQVMGWDTILYTSPIFNFDGA